MSNVLPCHHDEVWVLRDQDGYQLIRCCICRRAYVLTPDNGIIQVEAVLKLSELAQGSV